MCQWPETFIFPDLDQPASESLANFKKNWESEFGSDCSRISQSRAFAYLEFTLYTQSHTFLYTHPYTDIHTQLQSN